MMFIQVVLLHHTTALVANFGPTMLALYNYKENRRPFNVQTLVGSKVMKEMGEVNTTLTTQEALIVAMHDRNFIRYDGESANTITINSPIASKFNRLKGTTTHSYSITSATSTSSKRKSTS